LWTEIENPLANMTVLTDDVRRVFALRQFLSCLRITARFAARSHGYSVTKGH
jgi:hypothetical protein